jgi:hypothetical protein
MANRTRRQALQQGWEDFQRLLQAFQSHQERWTRWLDEELPPELPGEQVPPQTPPAKRARGRVPILTYEEVARLQAAYPAIRAAKPALSQKRVFDKLRELLPPDKRRISDTALRVHVIPKIAPK